MDSEGQQSSLHKNENRYFLYPLFFPVVVGMPQKRASHVTRPPSKFFVSLGGAKSSPDSSTQEAEANGTIEPCTGTLGGSKALAYGENVSFGSVLTGEAVFLCRGNVCFWGDGVNNPLKSQTNGWLNVLLKKPWECITLPLFCGQEYPSERVR